jgi:preprotein translocase YajC subunit
MMMITMQAPRCAAPAALIVARPSPGPIQTGPTQSLHVHNSCLCANHGEWPQRNHGVPRPDAAARPHLRYLLRAAVKKGDSVVTGGGLVGKVTKVEDDQVEVEIATGVKVKAVKSTLSDVMPLGGAKPAND